MRLIAALALLASLSALSLSASAETVSETTSRADGSDIHWQLTTRGALPADRLLLAAQGSGCAPARHNPNLAALAEAAAGFAVLTVEKIGVEPGDAPEDTIGDCRDLFHERHTVSRRVADARAVLADLEKRDLWDGETLALFGGSEGGAVVSILAREVAETDAVVVFSAGTGIPLAEQMGAVLPPPVAERLPQIVADIRANPRSTEIFGGNSYKWWADIMDRRLADDLLAADAPVLIVHGANDRSTPVAASRASVELFAEAGDSRLTYWELEDRDHAMRAPDGTSHLDAVLADVADWLDIAFTR